MSRNLRGWMRWSLSKGKGFGSFLKTAEHSQLAINQKAYKRRGDVEINEPDTSATVLSNVSRTEVLFNGMAALVQSWTDTEIVVLVPIAICMGSGSEASSSTTWPRDRSWSDGGRGTCFLMAPAARRSSG